MRGCRTALAVVVLTGLLSGPGIAGPAARVGVLIHPTLYRATGGETGVIHEVATRQGFQVEVVTATDQLVERATVEWIARSGRFDIVTLLDRDLHERHAAFLQALDGYMEKVGPGYNAGDIIPSLLAAGRIPAGGPLVGIPFRAGVGLLFYRKDLFEQLRLKVPTTLGELMDAAKRISEAKKEGKLDAFGLVQRAKDPFTGVEDFLRYVYAHGGRVMDPAKRTCLLDRPEGVAAERFLVDLIKSGAAPPDMVAYGRDEQIVAFQQGRVAMTVGFSPYYGLFEDARRSVVVGKTGFAPMPTAPGVPRGRSLNSVWYVTMDRNSRNKEAAWKIIEALTEPANQTRMAINFANGPVRTTIYRSRQYIEDFPLAPVVLDAMRASLSESHAQWQRMQDIIFEEHTAALLGRKAPEQAVAAMCQRMAPLLSR
ncbi:MAG: extracellular solute-binding protein [Armatimonadota bacterium]|nr:extracellular solute-binding protein [Armatimonadota bacterium]MDR7486731.1 extracellular solute-binding protein [Armatimonadota bacterium]MDR7534289.1 extracellular solute-binding protein [Armatimonadota bacterium]MDR7535360.1 extracellular solute-binding protein [Armatimonadota bacterium]